MIMNEKHIGSTLDSFLEEEGIKEKVESKALLKVKRAENGDTVSSQKNGKLYLYRCSKCERENYAMMVAQGVCAWCGYDFNKV
jgi:hypothetical protein